MARAFAEITFTDNVLEMQKQQGSDSLYAPFLFPESEENNELGDAEKQFISDQQGFYQATMSESGWPYVQFRGGTRGFIKVLDSKRIAYADFRGNRQYLSTGNLIGNDRVALILMDYLNRRRLKIWGHAKIVTRENDPEFVKSMHIKGYRALPERAIVIDVEAYDWNCPQHIPQMINVSDIQEHIAGLQSQISALQLENETLRSQIKV